MLADWLDTRRQEIVAVGISYEQEEAEPLEDGVLYPLWDAVLDNLRLSLSGQREPTLAAVKVAQQAQDLRLELPTFIRCLDTLRRAAQYVLGQEDAALADRLAGLNALNDALFLDCQVASTMLGSGAQARLVEERYLLRTLIDAMPDLIWAKDRDSNFLILNQAQATVMGVDSPEEAIGKNDFAFFPQEDAVKYRADEAEVIESGTGKVGFEERVKNAQGNIRWMQATKMPLRDSQGNITGIVGVVRDVTDIKLAQERAQQQQQVIESQKQVLAELSTPIIPIMDRIIVMPLIGAIDSVRAHDVMRSLLEGISRYRAKIAILDITGVPIVDSGVADHLNRTLQAARLKGTETIITGVTDAVAETIVDLGIDWKDVDIRRDLQSGLMAALERVGLRLNRGG